MSNNTLYGSKPKVKVSFGYGTLVQAATDDFLGGVNIGYDPSTGIGGIWKEGQMITSKVVDCSIAGTAEDGSKTVTVKYLGANGELYERDFLTVDQSLIDKINTPLPEPITFTGDEYIDISADNVISLRYSDLYQSVKDDLAADGIDNHEEINRQQSEHIFAIESSYVKSVAIDEEDDDYVVATIVVTSKESEDSEPVIEEKVITVPKENYIQGIIDSISALSSRIDIIDSSIIDINEAIDEAVSKAESDLANAYEIIDASVLYVKEELSQVDSSLAEEIQIVKNEAALKTDLEALTARTDVLDVSVNILEEDVEELKRITSIGWIDIHELLDN